MKTATSDVYAELESEAKRRGISDIALLAERAKAQGVRLVEMFDRLLATKGGTVRLVESRRQSQTATLAKAFEGLGLSPAAARIAAAGRAGLREASAATKHEDPGTVEGDNGKPAFAGGEFPASSYAYVPNASDPDTWWGLLATTPGGEPDPDFVRNAVAQLNDGNPGNPSIPEADLPDVLDTLRKAWAKALPDDELPAILTAEAAVFLKLGVPIKGLSAAARGRSRR